MSRILIIADDLSGAADCASAFAKAGMDALVVIDRDAAPDATAQVIAVDADSRRMPAAEAGRIHRELYARYAAGGQLLYRKIDSTLRGNFAEELAAIAAAAGLAIVAPAFPKAGRTTRDGRQYLNGVPLEQSEVWRAEGIAGVAHIPTMLERKGLRTAPIGLAEVRQGGASLAARFASLARQGVKAAVCDIETDDDLHLLASARTQLPMPCFWVGSAGLAEHLAAASQAPASARPAPAHLEVTGAVLTVVGSLSSVSREQAERLQAATRITGIAVPASILRQGPTHAEWSQQQQALDAALAGGRDLLLTIGIEEPVDMSEGLHLCQALAALTAPLSGRLGAVISTGGETARAILSAMGYHGLRLVGEIEPGVPLAIASGPRPLPVITKAGAFGGRDTLLHCHQALAQARRRPSGSEFKERFPMYLPIIAITMGDAAGVGPEIIMKSLGAADLYERCRPLVIGDAGRLREAAAIVGSNLEVHAIHDVADAKFEHGVVECIDLGLIPPGYPFGQLSPLCGHAAYCYIERAVALAMQQKIDAICTAPLNKEALHAGGHIFPGHTEMLAKLTNTPEVSMMLVAPNLRVIHVTTHIGLLDAIRRIEPGLVGRTIDRGYETLVRSGIANPRIGVCGINPHAGENGLFGCGEEEQKIIPAVKAQQALGRLVEGPLPADTLFYRAARGDFDLVVAMYHDQGHGPVKVMGLEAGVNITVGLPVIRTSVDHGTAFDIAGKGIADEGSLLEALRQAIALATRRG